MKKTYFEPSTEMVKVAVEQILMGSLNGVGGENVTMGSESDFDSFFGN
jgi:hypothetical protein